MCVGVRVGVCSEVCRKSAALDAEMSGLHQQLVASNEQLQQVETSRSEGEMELRRLDGVHADRLRQCQTLGKDTDYARQRETQLRVDR